MPQSIDLADLPGEVLELVPGYLERRRTDVILLQAALGSADYPVLSTLGHQLKGSGAAYGFEELSGFGASLEQAARARDIAEAGHQARLITEYLAKADFLILGRTADE